MKQVAISEFKAKCLALIDQVQKTKKPICITRFGKPVAQVSPPPAEKDEADWFGSMKDSIEILGDIITPANDEDDWEVFARLRLRLDTHIWIWSLQGSERLGRKTAQEIRNPENERWLSPVSTWEALTLNAKGRLRLPGDLAAWLNHATARFLEAPLTHKIALAVRRLPWNHRDPADRFLAATAQVLRLTLVTADTSLPGLGDISTLGNR